MKAVLRAVLPAIAVLALVPAVQARTFASVTIGTPTITLSDLALGDGIASAYAEGGPSVIDFDYLLGPAPVSSETVGRADITADTETRIAARTRGPASSFFAIGDRYAPSFTFTVTPGTAVTVGFDYTLETSIVGEPFRAGQQPSVSTNVELSVAAINNIRSNEFGELEYDFLAHEVDSASLSSSTNPLRALLQQDRGRLSATFENLSTGDAVFAFRAEMVAFGNSAPSWNATPLNVPAAPVPEPETYALMLAGLAAVGWCTRRRKAG